MRDSMDPGDLAAVEPPQGHGAWSHTDMLLAEVADRIAEQTWILGQWKRQPPRPKPIQRPGVGEPVAKRGPRTLDEVRAAASPEARAAAERLLAGRRRT